jgi:hypothetical protein
MQAREKDDIEKLKFHCWTITFHYSRWTQTLGYVRATYLILVQKPNRCKDGEI